MHEPLLLREQDVLAVMGMSEAIDAVRAGFRQEGAGRATNMLKTHLGWGGGTLHAIGGHLTEHEVLGTKTWAHTPKGASPLVILFGADDGYPLAIIEAFILGQLRTSAVSGLVTDLLADPDASELALIGTGKQAFPQVAAVAAVRPLARVRVHSRNPAHCADFARRVEEGLGIETVPSASVAAAVEGAPIVTLATRATTPYLEPNMIAVGTHINAMGAITPERQEFAPELLDRASCIVTDSVAAVRALSREFQQYFDEGGHDWERVQPLSSLVSAHAPRGSETDVTLSKAMGTGICDVAVGLACLHRCQAEGRGVVIEIGGRPSATALEAKLAHQHMAGGVL